MIEQFIQLITLEKSLQECWDFFSCLAILFWKRKTYNLYFKKKRKKKERKTWLWAYQHALHYSMLMIESSGSFPLDITNWFFPYITDRHVKLTWLMRLINIKHPSLMQSHSGTNQWCKSWWALPCHASMACPIQTSQTVANELYSAALVLKACQTSCQGHHPSQTLNCHSNSSPRAWKTRRTHDSVVPLNWIWHVSPGHLVQ